MPAFSKKEAIIASWEMFKSRWRFLVGVTLTVGLVNYGGGFLINNLVDTPVVSLLLVSLAVWLLSLLVNLGIIRIALETVDQREASFSQLFSQYRLIIKYLLGSLLYGLVVLGGTLLLVIPGIIAAVRLQFWSYLLVDKGMGPVAALSHSFRMTAGATLNLILFNLLLLLLGFLGILALGIGTLVTTPLTFLSTAWVYRKLSA